MYRIKLLNRVVLGLTVMMHIGSICQAEHCWTWSDGGSASIDITSPTEAIETTFCQEFDFTVEIDDLDHVEDICDDTLEADLYDYFEDVDWTLALGNNPNTGTIVSEDSIWHWWGEENHFWESSMTWRAPVTLGTVDVTAESYDVGCTHLFDWMTMLPNCSGSDLGECVDLEDPETEEDTKTATVVLPAGCTSGVATASFSATKVAQTSSPSCGATDQDPIPFGNIGITAVYKNNEGKWTFQLTATNPVRCGPVSLTYDVVNGNEVPNVNTTLGPLPCVVADNMRNGSGCIVLTSGQKISNSACVQKHEDYHFQRFLHYLKQEEAEAVTNMPEVAIDCSEEYTKTCTGVSGNTTVKLQIYSLVLSAYNNAMASMAAEPDTGAQNYARSCFVKIADKICAHAGSSCTGVAGACP